ncbi:M24 family metallopeptidase [Myxococcota bacterium]|nr:M24 family metallopeptidase [Myxococcota bacterium]
MSGEPGLSSLSHEPPIDLVALRQERLARCLAEMKRTGVDVLLLSRDSNATFAAGSRRLWYAGSRPFGPTCIVVRKTGAVHLMTVHEDGIPPEIPRENLYGFAWGTSTFMASVMAVPGVDEAQRIGVDAMTPAYARLLKDALPQVEWVNGEELMIRARSEKSPAELACIRGAMAITHSAINDVLAAIEPGVSEAALRSLFVRRAAEYGVTIPAFEASFLVSPREAPTAPSFPIRRSGAPRALREGDVVNLDAGIMLAGYEGSVACSTVCTNSGHSVAPLASLAQRWRDTMDSMLEVCLPGRPITELRQAYRKSGEPLPAMLIAHGVGLGMEPPIVPGISHPEDTDTTPLERHDVLALQAYVFEDGVGGYLGREIVRLTPEGPEVLRPLDLKPLSQ